MKSRGYRASPAFPRSTATGSLQLQVIALTGCLTVVLTTNSASARWTRSTSGSSGWWRHADQLQGKGEQMRTLVHRIKKGSGRLNLLRFIDIATSGTPEAKIVILAKLLSPAGEIIKSKQFETSAPASGSDTRDYVDALSTAFSQMERELLDWTTAALDADPATAVTVEPPADRDLEFLEVGGCAVDADEVVGEREAVIACGLVAGPVPVGDGDARHHAVELELELARLDSGKIKEIVESYDVPYYPPFSS